MLNVDQEYKDLYNSCGGKKLKLTFFKTEYMALYPSETLYPSTDLYPIEMSEESIDFIISDDMIQTDSISIVQSICSEEDLTFGLCESSEFEINVSGLEEEIVGREFLLTVGFGAYELVLGLYTVDSTPKQEDKDTRKIIAYDRMRRFDNDVAGWYHLLEFPMTLKDFRDSLCAFIGIEQEISILVNDSMVIEKTINPSALKGRDVLQYICQINGVFGNIAQNGRLRYISIPKTSNVSGTMDIYQVAYSEEYSVPDIDTVKIQQEEGDIGGTSTGGDDMNVYIIEGNPLVYGKTTSQLIEIANNVISVIGGLSYCPAEIVTNGSPWIEVGDRIQLETSDGTVNTIVMNRTLTGIQGSMDELVSTGSQELKRKFNIESEFIQIKGLTAILKRTVEEVSNELTNLENSTNSRFTQTAANITAEVNRATAAEGTLSSRITVNANSITSEVNRATQAEGTLSSRITQTENSIKLKVDVGSVSSEISLEDGDITIEGNRFTLISDNCEITANGRLWCVDGEFEGTITAGAFYADSTVIELGEFTIDASEQYKMYASGFSLETANTPSGSVAMMTLGNSSNKTIIEGGNIDATGLVYCSAVYADDTDTVSEFYDIRPGKSWWGTASLTEVQQFWSKMIFQLAKIVDNQWSNYDSIYDALDTWWKNNHPYA